MNQDLEEIRYRARIYADLRERARRILPSIQPGHPCFRAAAESRAYLELLLAGYRAQRKITGQL